jgi:hypothetical protein
VKKLLLAGVAALSALTASAAHADDTAPPPSPCAIVNPPNDENWRPKLLNVRETPDLKSRILRQLSARDNIRLTSQAGEWVDRTNPTTGSERLRGGSLAAN